LFLHLHPFSDPAHHPKNADLKSLIELETAGNNYCEIIAANRKIRLAKITKSAGFQQTKLTLDNLTNQLAVQKSEFNEKCHQLEQNLSIELRRKVVTK
jgi:hypothetical protein